MSMKVFLDSSVVVAALISSQGGSAKIFSLCEAGVLRGYISNDVVEEVQTVIDRKIPELGKYFSQLIKISKIKLAKNPSSETKKMAKNWISDPNDVAILAAAKEAEVDYLITLDVRHFIKDRQVAIKSGLKIVTPAEFLNDL